MKSEQRIPAGRKRPAPGDEAAPGTPGTGKIIRGIGGA